MTAAQRSRPALWTSGVRAVIFYGSMTALLGLMMSGQVGAILPAGLAGQVAHNSEAVLYALLVCAAIQLVAHYRPRTSLAVSTAAAFAVACLGLAVALLQSELRSSIRTLNEPLIAAGLTALYVSLPRPVRWPFAWSGVLLALVVVFFDTQLVLDHAESLVPLIIAPVALDVVDRSLLDPRQPDRPRLRLAWCGCLAGWAVLSLLLARAVRPELSGPVELGIDYSQRAAEAYWGWLIIHLALGFWLPGRIRDPEPRHRAAPDPPGLAAV